MDMNRIYCVQWFLLNQISIKTEWQHLGLQDLVIEVFCVFLICVCDNCIGLPTCMPVQHMHAVHDSARKGVLGPGVVLTSGC